MTCGHCNLTWDDGKVTSMTPVPSGRCPFELFHVYPEPDPVERRPENYITKKVDESNWTYCQRAAAAVRPEVLIQDLMTLLQEKERLLRTYGQKFGPLDRDDEDEEADEEEYPEVEATEAWVLISEATGHGSGFSSAIAERFQLE